MIARKTGACNKTGNGAATHAVNASVLATARKNGLSPVAYLAQVLVSAHPHPPLPVLARASP